MIRDRQLIGELMDQPDLDRAEHRRALNGLRRLNALSLSDTALWARIGRLAACSATRPLRLLDLACGGGDNAIRIARRAARAGLPLEVHGCDLSALAIEESRSRAMDARVNGVSFSRLDALRDPLPSGFHVVMCSLYLHHLAQEDAVRLMHGMALATNDLVLISDLRRTSLGYALACAASHVVSRSPIVHVDAPRSVAAAFTSAEARQLASLAGLTGAKVTQHWPQRWLLSWAKG